MTPPDASAAAREHRLCAAVLAAPAVDTAIEGLVHTITQLTLEAYADHIAHAARARDAKERNR